MVWLVLRLTCPESEQRLDLQVDCLMRVAVNGQVDNNCYRKCTIGKPKPIKTIVNDTTYHMRITIETYERDPSWDSVQSPFSATKDLKLLVTSRALQHYQVPALDWFLCEVRERCYTVFKLLKSMSARNLDNITCTHDVIWFTSIVFNPKSIGLNTTLLSDDRRPIDE